MCTRRCTFVHQGVEEGAQGWPDFPSLSQNLLPFWYLCPCLRALQHHNNTTRPLPMDSYNCAPITPQWNTNNIVLAFLQINTIRSTPCLTTVVVAIIIMAAWSTYTKLPELLWEQRGAQQALSYCQSVYCSVGDIVKCTLECSQLYIALQCTECVLPQPLWSYALFQCSQMWSVCISTVLMSEWIRATYF